MPSIAIIGGTGLESLPPESRPEPFVRETPFGPASLIRAMYCGKDVLFLSRHGADHDIAPHEINYQANIAALTDLGVKQVLATNAVGSLRLDLPPGSFVLLDDFIDFTRGRRLSYWDGHPQRPDFVIHRDFSTPYCPNLRRTISRVAERTGVPVITHGTYVCAEGPRFESPAEVRLFAHLGGDVIGMTGLPEAVFAREAGLCYAAVAIVTNYGAGLTSDAVDHNAVVSQMKEQALVVRDLLMKSAVEDSVQHCTYCSLT